MNMNDKSAAEHQKIAAEYIEKLSEDFDDTLKQNIEEIEEATKDELRSLHIQAFDLEQQLKSIKQSISYINSENRKKITKQKTKWNKDKIEWEKTMVRTSKLHAKQAFSGEIYKDH